MMEDRVEMAAKPAGRQQKDDGKNGRRFVVRPTANWQKVTVERSGISVLMKVDDEDKPSVERINPDVTANNLVTDGILYIRFIGQRGEFRNLQVDE